MSVVLPHPGTASTAYAFFNVCLIFTPSSSIMDNETNLLIDEPTEVLKCKISACKLVRLASFKFSEMVLPLL